MEPSFTKKTVRIFPGKNYVDEIINGTALRKLMDLFLPAAVLSSRRIEAAAIAAGGESNSPVTKRLKPAFFINTVLLALITLASGQALGQKAPSSITTIKQVPVKNSATVNGYGNDPEYPTANSYNLRFGSQDATTDGTNNVIKSFVVDGLTYKPIPRPAATPYDTVILKRKANPKVADLGKFTAFYQNNGGVIAPATKATLSGTTLYYPPEYVNSMENLINSYIVNRGTDNLFANDNGATLNNIERVDLILSGGVTAADVVKTGFLLMERGGNDPYKIAAITSLTPDGQVASLGKLVSGPTSAWGSTGITITSTVFQRNTGDAEIRPNQNIEPQPIKGSYISFQSLGIPARTTIYGIALFPDDVTSATDLLNLTNVPLNTGAASGVGGLDFMAGGGFFVEENQQLAFSLSGNVFDDGDALNNSLIDGTGTGNPGGSQLYAYLVGADNLIKAKNVVTADGTYVFDNQLTGNTNYTVVISTANLAVNDPAPDDAALPANWVLTGDSYGNSNQEGDGIEMSSPDLRIPVRAVDASITNVNFGIEQLPFAGSGTVTMTNPGGTISATVPASTFTNITPSSDADGNITSILISYPAANANTITIGNATYNASQFATAFPIGYLLSTDGKGNPVQTIKVDPASDGNTTVVIPFVAIDNAYLQSSNTGTATIIFTRGNQLPVAVNDVNSTKQNTPVDGTVTDNDTPSADGGNVWTLAGINGGAAHGKVTMKADGSYTYTPDTDYYGTDVFNYSLCDVDPDCSSATVTITIARVNHLPVAANDVNSTDQNVPVSGSVTGNDTPSQDGGNTWSLVGTNGGAAHGTVTMTSTGSYTYTPATDYYGTDVFNYSLCDVDNDCSPATVTITIGRVNHLPVAANDVNSTNQNTPVSSSVTGNDTPSQDGGNTWSLIGTNGGAAHGTVTLTSTGNYTYTPATGYYGTDVFNYRLCDVDNDCSSATVTITIGRVNHLPVAVNDVNSTNQNVPVSGSVTGNDTPSQDGGNTWTLVGTNGGAAHGTVTMSSTGNYTYTPANNYTGTDVFSYRLCDVDNDCSSATVTITISPVVTYCGCTPSPSDILTNGSFESGITGWSSSGGNLTSGSGYAVCGSKNAFLQRTSGTAKMWQDVTGIPVGSTVTLKAWAGTHTPGLSCNPKLILGFYNSAGSLISANSVTVDKDVDKPDYKLKEFTVTATVPTGTVKVRVEGDITCNWLKLDAVCLTVSGTPVTGSIGNLVWNDVNNNGKQDAGEQGIAGASVKITYPGGTTAVKTTDNSGNYSFTGLAAGTYKVTFTTPSGFVASAANQGTNDEIDSDPVNGDVSLVLTAGQNNNTIDAGFHVVVCTNTTQHTETYPNQFNTGFSASLNNKTFAGSSGTWTANSNSNATVVVLKPYYSPSTSYALKIVNFNTKKSGAGSCSAASPKLNLTGACCPDQLKMTFTLWTYACTYGDNNASLRLDFSKDNGTTWMEVAAGTSAQLFSSYGANGKTVITVPVPVAYQTANFKYRFRGEMAANDPNNFYLFIDDISITSPASCTSTSAHRGVAVNTLPSAIVDTKDELEVKVLSNPSISAFQLNIQSSVKEGVTVRITDMFGRTVKVIEHVQSNSTVNVGADLQPGNYFAEVKQGSSKKVLKLVKL